MVGWTSFGIGRLVILHHSVSPAQLESILPNTLKSGSRDPNEISPELRRSDSDYTLRLGTAPDIIEGVSTLPRVYCMTCQVQHRVGNRLNLRFPYWVDQVGERRQVVCYESSSESLLASQSLTYILKLVYVMKDVYM